MLGGGGGGVLKAKLLEEKYEASLEFPSEGAQHKKPSMVEGGGGGGVWIFSGTTHCGLQLLQNLTVTNCHFI